MEKEYIVAIITIIGSIIAALAPSWYSNRKKSRLSPTLNAVLALAEMQCRVDGEEVTSTRYFFSAALYLCPDEIEQLLVELQNSAALPPPTPTEIALKPRTMQLEQPFSACIRNSLAALMPKASKKSPLTVSDLFVDVAKFGKGSSVAKLRNAGITAEKIDEIVSRYGINVPHRRNA